MSTNNSGCGCNTANTSIACTVSQCKHHCKSSNYCSLNKIAVGALTPEPDASEYTECRTFTAE